MTVLSGRCIEGESARSFAPWVDALGDYVRGLDGAQLQDQLGQHAAVLAQILPSLREALPDLAPRSATSPAEGRLRLFDAAVHVVLAASHHRPVLLVLEDLHWADRASLALLRHLARRIAEAPVVLLGTLREEELPPHVSLDELIAMLRREARSPRLSSTGVCDACLRLLGVAWARRARARRVSRLRMRKR